ncbi:MAG: hypothetical protein RLY86_2512 [Pseudomonadota bacterium]
MDAQTFTVPLNKLKSSPANVRRTGREQGIAELAASIAAHGLINPLRVEPERDADGRETGAFLVHAGERRRRALLHLAAEKKLKKSEPIPCLPRGGSPAEEESLAENVNTAPMHPADQYEAFARLHREQGLGAEEIAARFGLTAATVRQRLRLGAASPVLMEQYRAGAMNLDQLMAFCLTDDHATQERVWGDLTWSRSPETIRRLLTRTQVPASDRRALFIGADAYAAAGGEIVRDLFTEDGGGWFADSTLLDRLVAEKLEREAAAVRAEGWKWVSVSAEFPYALAADLRRVWPEPVVPTEEEAARAEELRDAYTRLEEEHAALPVMPDDVAARLVALEAELAAIEERETYAPEDVALAGAFVCLGFDGMARVERGYLRREDDPTLAPQPALTASADPGEVRTETVECDALAAGDGTTTVGDVDTPVAASDTAPEPADDPAEAQTGLPDRLVEELTGHRTAAMQILLAQDPDTALRAVTHALALRCFYGATSSPHTCLRIEPATASLSSLGDCRANREMADLYQGWTKRLPRSAGELWGWVYGQTRETVLDLLAFCAGRTLYAVHCPWTAEPRRIAHADALASALDLDMTGWWQPTADRYLSRVTKAAIQAAVREGVGVREADALTGLKKPEMVTAAERLLSGTGWLPALLRTAPAAARPDGAEALAQAAE